MEVSAYLRNKRQFKVLKMTSAVIDRPRNENLFETSLELRHKYVIVRRSGQVIICFARGCSEDCKCDDVDPLRSRFNYQDWY